jgi:hypothetical protein
MLLRELGNGGGAQLLLLLLKLLYLPYTDPTVIIPLAEAMDWDTWHVSFTIGVLCRHSPPHMRHHHPF